jgi:serine/threonine protein kinase
MDVTSVESLCNLLARSRLLSADDVRALRQRWLCEGGKAVNNLGAFAAWLVASQYVTEYQSNLLLRGKAERFFLSEYKLLERVGKGRMAGVYKAVHRLGQVVAIKVLPPSKVKDPQAFGRFQREARLAVKLNHPHVVRTLQTGEDFGLHYLVMEYLDGETLEELLARRGKLSAAEALPLLLQALQGLNYLHEQDLVHRDLKPANLMLLPALDSAGGSALTLKVLDIGLGRALFDEAGDGGGAALELTAEGALLGEPDYMAPEQARDAHAADIRADIYSLGCVLYHMLAGRPPFPDANRVRKLVRHVTETPRPVKESNPQVHDAVQQVLDRMLAKDPAQRYPTPETAIEAVQKCLTRLTTTPAAPAAKVAPAPPVPMAMPVPPPAAKPAFDPIASAPAAKPPRGSWKQHLHVGGRDLIVFVLGVVFGLVLFVAGALIVSWLRSKS